MIYSILVAVQVVVALTLIGLILVQHGKGADAGAAFGSGASGTMFGAKGTANFLSRATAALATIFFAISLTLAYLVHGASVGGGTSVTDQLSHQSTTPTAPANGHSSDKLKPRPAGKTAKQSGAGASSPAGSGGASQNKGRHNSGGPGGTQIPQ